MLFWKGSIVLKDSEKQDVKNWVEYCSNVTILVLTPHLAG